jgi:type I restriction enzyme S subunit
VTVLEPPEAAAPPQTTPEHAGSGSTALPNGWRWTRLLDVTLHHSGNGKLIKGKLNDAPADDLFPAFSASGQDVWRDGFESEGEAIIVSAVGARCGKCFLATGKWSAIANTHVIWPASDLIDRKFLWYRINDERFWIRSGSAQPFVVVRKTFEQPIPLPPLDEQQRIVAEIEKQFTRLEAGVASLKRVQASLKRYRASVLKAACEGRLVPTEAEWEQLPLKELIGKISQGWSPKCDLTRDAPPEEWAIVTTTAVQSMRYIDNQGKLLPTTFEPRPHLEIKAGDFLMTRKGPRKRAGVACLVRSTRPRLMVCDTVYRFRCDRSRVLPEYLELALNAPAVVEAIDRQKAGINESGVSLTHDKLGAIGIPLPPFAEQQRIVAEVERRLSVNEQLEGTVAANLERSNKLRRSILQRAIAGDLAR